MNWRRSEIISIGTLTLLGGWIWYASAKVKTYDVVTDATKGNDALDRRTTVLETHIKDEDDEVLRLLREIKRTVR